MKTKFSPSGTVLVTASLYLFCIQGILAAVISTVLGAKDPDQVNSMAKQAGEVRKLSLQRSFVNMSCTCVHKKLCKSSLILSMCRVEAMVCD